MVESTFDFTDFDVRFVDLEGVQLDEVVNAVVVVFEVRASVVDFSFGRADVNVVFGTREIFAFVVFHV